MSSTLWDQTTGVWRRTPRSVVAQPGNVVIDTQWYAEQERWDELAAWSIYEEWRSEDPAPMGYNQPVIEAINGRDRAARYPAGTAQEQADATRQGLSSQIEGERMEADVRQIDLAQDPGKQGLLDEANAAAEAKQIELDETDDADLPAFDPILYPGSVTAMASAQSLINQELVIYSQPSLSPDDRAAIDASMVAQQAVIDAGDPAAEVPGVPAVVRRFIGVNGEGYGTLIFGRVQSGGWWYPEWTLRVDRELDVSEYWVAVYDDGGTYLSTPFLTEVEPGVYRADKTATNLPGAIDRVFQATICHAHISNPQFGLIRYAANVTAQVDRVRWAGLAV